MLQPISGVPEWTGFEPARTPLGVTAAGNQTCAFQDLEMLGDRRQAHPERLGQFGDGSLAGSEAGEDRAPGGVGESREGSAEMIGRHAVVNHSVN